VRLLIIEDYSPLRESLARGLKDAGYAVDTAANGVDGLWFAENHPYDVVLLDLMLPGIDGFQLLRKLRGAGNTTHVLVLTARDAVSDRVLGLDLGADDYVIKPFAFDELLARLRAMVRRQYDRVDPVIRIGDLEVDTRARRARRSGRVVALSAREYTLLEYLALRTGQIVSRTELWEHAYDQAAEPGSNVLDVHISHLRKKIDGGTTPKLLHTRRGLGYVLGEDRGE
jgi:DNA-binding response OmpR family regulator